MSSTIEISIDGETVISTEIQSSISPNQMEDDSFCFHGCLDGYECCSFVSRSGRMMIVAGCRVYTVQEGLDHWRDKPDRTHIFALCELLAKIAKANGNEISYADTLLIKSADIRDILRRIRDDGLVEDEDTLIDDIEALLNGAVAAAQEETATDEKPKKKRKI